jgi:WD40 repeat protein
MPWHGRTTHHIYSSRYPDRTDALAYHRLLVLLYSVSRGAVFAPCCTHTAAADCDTDLGVGQGGDDAHVRVWDRRIIADGRPVGVCSGHVQVLVACVSGLQGAPIYCLAPSPLVVVDVIPGHPWPPTQIAYFLSSCCSNLPCLRCFHMSVSPLRCPMSVFVQGITHIDSRGDGRYFISNGKDHQIKLWDVRAMRSRAQASRHHESHYDYRHGGRGLLYGPRSSVAPTFRRHEADGSLMTYTGHVVTHTLIRARFSPAFTTGQKYIYSGSADGQVVIWNVLTGEVLERLKGHDQVREVCTG